MEKRKNDVFARQQVSAEKNYPLEDAALKVAAQYFGEELLPYLGITDKLEYIAPTESVHLEVRKLYQDFNYVLEDGSWLHLEFESDSIKTEDMRRFREYEATTSRIHRVEVTTCVICSSSVKDPLTEIRTGLNRYRIRVIRLKDKNADEIFEMIFRKQKNRVPLTKNEIVQVMLTPLMSGESSEKARVLNVCKILKCEEDRTSADEIEKLEAVMYALAVKFLNRKELEEVKEELKMTILGELLREDAIQEGRNEGREEGRAQTIISMICKKLRKGQDEAQIAEDIEEELAYVKEICEIARKYAPDYDEEKVFKEVSLR